MFMLFAGCIGILWGATELLDLLESPQWVTGIVVPVLIIAFFYFGYKKWAE